MNAVLMNRDGFLTPADGFYQIAPLGEFAHAQAGLTQVVDAEACAAMVNRFTEDAKAPNFAGLLVDFDHFSLDGEKKSEAAGWITALEMRNSECGAGNGDASRGVAEAQSGGGLFAKIRWSDVGDAAVQGGRYRFLSPVWARSDCADLGNGRVRPLRLLNAAVTNDPNLKGMRPLSNSGPSAEHGMRNAESGGANAQPSTSNAQPSSAAQRFKWVLGAAGKGGHCPSCEVMAGKVHTMPEWEASGVTPGCGALFCRGNCHCALVPTDDPSDGVVVPGPLHKLTNTGWTDAARAASLAVRQARAHGRVSSPRYSSGAKRSSTPRYADPSAGSGKSAGAAADDDAAEQAAHEKAADEAEHQDTPDSEGDDKSAEAAAADRAAQAAEDAKTDAADAYKKSGLAGMTDEQKQALSDQIGQKVRDGEPLTPEESDFVKESSGDNVVHAPPGNEPPMHSDGQPGLPSSGDNVLSPAESKYLDHIRGKLGEDGSGKISSAESAFLQDLTDRGIEGNGTGDPLSAWQEAHSDGRPSGGVPDKGAVQDGGTPVTPPATDVPPVPGLSPDGGLKGPVPVGAQKPATSDKAAARPRAASSAKQAETNGAVAAKFAASGLDGLTPAETAQLNNLVVQKVRNGVALNPAETAFVKAYYGK